MREKEHLPRETPVLSRLGNQFVCTDDRGRANVLKFTKTIPFCNFHYCNMKTIDYSRLSSLLRRTFAQNPSHLSKRAFAIALKPVLNEPEANRLFDYYTDVELCLRPVTKRYFAWHGIHQDHFEPDAIRDIFLKYPIQTIHPGKKKESEDLLFMPEQKDSPIAPEGKVYDCKSELVEEKPVLKSIEEIISDIELSIKMLDAHGFYLTVDGARISIKKSLLANV